MILCACRQIH